GSRAGRRARARARLLVPADARAEYRVRATPASATRRRLRREDRGAGSRLAGRARLRAVRDLRLRTARSPLPAQFELLAIRRLLGCRRRRARQSHAARSRPDRAPSEDAEP